MKTDEELTERLKRASRTVWPPDDPLDRLHGRRATKRRRERLAAGSLALAVLVGAVGSSLFAWRGMWGSHRQTMGSDGWTPARSLALRPGQYFYLKGTTLGNADGSRIDQESWWAPDRSGELRFSTNRSDKYKPLRQPEGVYGKGEFRAEDLSSLSTDPAILQEQLRERAEGGESLWSATMSLLDFELYPNALPELRAALFDVAIGLKGVTREDGVVDPVGRHAIALRMDEMVAGVNDRGKHVDYTIHWALYFDPGTHQLLAEAASIGDETPVPFEILQSAIVDSRGAEPTDDRLLFPRPLRQPRLRLQPSLSLP